jgi:broad specificity phosphatase PhoE
MIAEISLPRVYLVRHARPSSTWGAGAENPGLDDLGMTQAREAAHRLMSAPAAERPSRVVSSPLRRCLETAKPLADALGLAVEIDPLVGEIPTPARLAPPERPGWLGQAMAGRWRDIEGDLDYDDWRGGVAAAVGRHSQAAIFSHFVAINAVMSVVMRSDQVICFRPDHASVTTLALEAGGMRLVTLGAEAATGVL